MSRKQFSGGGMNRTVVELDVDTSRICGTGGADYPALYWQAQLSISRPNAPLTDYIFRIVQAQLWLQPGSKIADARTIVLGRIMYGFQNYDADEYLNFEFPLDSRRIEAIERHRQSGSVKMRFDVQIHVDEFAPIQAPAESKRPNLWGPRNNHRLTLQEGIEIPQTHWISNVLPGLGYGKVHVLEFPAASLEKCEALDNSFKALNQAVEAHRQGRYDDAAAKCRVALDPFFEYEERSEPNGSKRRIPIVKKSWETRAGEKTYQWLNGTLGVLKAAANPSHHTPNSHFDQVESQMLIAVTAAVVNYAARILGQT
jgi:hypothetical protein